MNAYFLVRAFNWQEISAQYALSIDAVTKD